MSIGPQSSSFGNTASMATIAAYIAENQQCCATNTVTIGTFQDDISSAKASISSLCSAVSL